MFSLFCSSPSFFFLLSFMVYSKPKIMIILRKIFYAIWLASIWSLFHPMFLFEQLFFMYHFSSVVWMCVFIYLYYTHKWNLLRESHKWETQSPNTTDSVSVILRYICFITDIDHFLSINIANYIVCVCMYVYIVHGFLHNAMMIICS